MLQKVLGFCVRLDFPSIEVSGVTERTFCKNIIVIIKVFFILLFFFFLLFSSRATSAINFKISVWLSVILSRYLSNFVAASSWLI